MIHEGDTYGTHPECGGSLVVDERLPASLLIVICDKCKQELGVREKGREPREAPDRYERDPF